MSDRKIEVSAELWERFQEQAGLYREAVDLLERARQELLMYANTASGQREIAQEIEDFLNA